MNRPYLFRGDIALMINVSVRQVERNEVRWGLRPHREDLNRRVIRYRRDGVIAALSKSGFSVAQVAQL